MIEKTIVVGSFKCNCRLFACQETGFAVLVDPGDEPQRILKEVSGLKTSSGLPVRVQYLLHTHGHLDHIGGSRAIKESDLNSSVRIALHKEDEPLYQGLKKQGELFGIHYEEPLPIDHYLQDNEILQVGKLKIEIFHTPGHSPGSVCMKVNEETLLSGDTLFQGDVGRTDLWGGDEDQMFKSIRERLWVLDDEIRVCPGHGPSTTIGHEKRFNRYLS